MNAARNRLSHPRRTPLYASAIVLFSLLWLASAASAQYRYELLKAFDGTNDGNSPNALILGSDGTLYGTTRDGVLFKVNRDGSGFAVFARARGEPTGLLAEATDGLLYGATRTGGTNGSGTVFRIQRDGSGYTELHHFAAFSWSGALLEGSDGVLYGTTFSYSEIESGTVFKMQRDGSQFAVLHRFGASIEEESMPGPLLECSDGALYGLTRRYGCAGRIDRDGSGYRVLHRFGDELEEKGLGPELIEGSDGALYGTAAGEAIRLRDAMLFRLQKDGSGFSVVLRDCGAYGKVIELANRKLCIPNDFTGVCGLSVLAVNPDGSGFQALKRFNYQEGPPNCLVEGPDGSLYGTTRSWGDEGFGTVFALRPQPVMSPPLLSEGAVTLWFTSRPDSTNQIQRTTSLGGSWITLTNLAVGGSGVGEFTDTVAPGTNAFYRVVRPGL